jgi:single-stranded-DNA-specific exonuclease
MDQVAEKANQQIVPEVVAQILAGRGLAAEHVDDFLYPKYPEHLHDPFAMKGMNKAVTRIEQAILNNEVVVVYGDYDIDGITATTVLVEGLRANGLEAIPYIPDRFEEGYGLNLEALANIKAAGTNLVISVDCGITSVIEAKWCQDNNLDLIITDHHTPPEVLPEAVAVINPKQPSDEYPFKDLCGAGVAFKLVQALQQTTGKPAEGQEKWLLDLVALGTVCDVVSLVGENRVLVSYGLKVLQKTRRPGLKALMAVGGVLPSDMKSFHLGFVLGPRLNAAGRLEHANRSLDLLSTTDAAEAAQIAADLDTLNRQRRAYQDTIFAAADAMAEQYADDPILVLADPDWSHGVVGIVASKLVEKHRKPVLVMQILGDTTKGSGRSTSTYSMVDGLTAVSQYLQRFGGHFFAAGCTLNTEDLDAFRQALNQHFREGGFAKAAPQAAQVDYELKDSNLIDWPLHQALALMEPFGMGNPEPVLRLERLTLAQLRPVGAQGQHLKFDFTTPDNKRLSGIGFGLAAKYRELQPGLVVGAVFRLQENTFQGRTTLQLQVLELHS